MDLNFDNFDFIDFGCSSGESIEFGKKKFGGIHGVGIDIDPNKVEIARKRGYNAELLDATKLDLFEDKVRFAILSHFLEHLPGSAMAKKCILSACKVARDFIYIQQPYFDADGLLFKEGLKLYWSNWKGHQYHMGVLEFHNILNPLVRSGEIIRFKIYGDEQISNSDHPCIHSIESPVDQHKWEKNKHPEKEQNVFFEFDCFKQTKVLIQKNPDISFLDLENSFSFTKVFFDSKA